MFIAAMSAVTRRRTPPAALIGGMSTETVEKTMIVKTRGRAWFTGVIGGTKAQLAINDVSTDLPLDSIVTFRGDDLSVRTRYGVTLRFSADEIISVRDAAQAREEAAALREIEKWVCYAEADIARDLGYVSNAMKRAVTLGAGHPTFGARVAEIAKRALAIREAEPRRDAEKWLGWAEEQVVDGLTSSRSIDEALRLCAAFPELVDRLAALREAVAANQEKRRATELKTTLLAEPGQLGVPVRHRDAWVVFTEVLRSRVIDSDDPAVYGGHLLGFEGSRGYVVAYRDATLEEIANAEQAQEQARLLRTEHRVRKMEARAIARTIETDGERPERADYPDGDHFLGERTLYGGGQWVVVDADYIWSMHGNGADGDDWSANNVGGNIGWRIPRTDEMVASIRALHDAGARL
jgi:hypothetical protein